jgi:hypothetical protein
MFRAMDLPVRATMLPFRKDHASVGIIERSHLPILKGTKGTVTEDRHIDLRASIPFSDRNDGLSNTV